MAEHEHPTSTTGQAAARPAGTAGEGRAEGVNAWPEVGAADVEGGTGAVLFGMLTTFAEVLSGLDTRLAAIEEALRQRDAELAAVGELDARLAAIEGLLRRHDADLTAVRDAVQGSRAAHLHDGVARLTEQVDALAARLPPPAPGVTVDVGLAERLEELARALAGLLEENAVAVGRLDEQVQGGLERLTVSVEGRQAGLDSLLDTVRAMAGVVEGVGVRMDAARDRVEEVVGAALELPRPAEELRPPDAMLPEHTGAAGGRGDEAAAAVAAVVRSESELLAQRVSAVAVVLDAVRSLLEAHVAETSHSLGRRASDAGRRLASDLGLRQRPKRPLPGRGAAPGGEA